MDNTFSRPDGRATSALRRYRITPGVMKHAEGSVLVEFGDTRILVSASVENRVPGFLYGSGKGWLTAEYDMLPRATTTRNRRAASQGKQSGRSLEIGRLIGRSLRNCIDTQKLGERTLWIDCDVIQADGGTRTAAITGGFVALAMALADLKKRKLLSKPVLKNSVAAISVGVYKNVPVLDLNYLEDKDAEADVNVVMTGKGEFVEIQGTAEGAPFGSEHLNAMLDLAKGGIAELTQAQAKAMASFDRDDIWLPGARG